MTAAQQQAIERLIEIVGRHAHHRDGFHVAVQLGDVRTVVAALEKALHPAFIVPLDFIPPAAPQPTVPEAVRLVGLGRCSDCGGENLMHTVKCRVFVPHASATRSALVDQ